MGKHWVYLRRSVDAIIKSTNVAKSLERQPFKKPFQTYLYHLRVTAEHSDGAKSRYFQNFVVSFVSDEGPQELALWSTDFLSVSTENGERNGPGLLSITLFFK